MKINKRYTRNIKENLSFYLSSLVLTMVALLAFFLMNIAGNGILDFADDFFAEHQLEDANFSVYVDIPEEDISEIEETFNLQMEAQKYINIEQDQKTVRVFQVTKKINTHEITEGTDIDSDFEQTKMFGGYDHNFAVAGEGYRLCAAAENPANGIVMETYTNQPGVQLYTTNIDNENTGKNGAKYANHHGFCLETQAFPNAAKFTHFPSPVLKKNAVYDYTTEYRFSVK